VTLGGFALLLVTAVCMAGANLLLKNGIAQAGGFEPSLSALWQLARQPAVAGGVLLTAAGALMWFRVLATQKLSTCYPLFVSLTYFLIRWQQFISCTRKSRYRNCAAWPPCWWASRSWLVDE
jgi:hypothetical protein